MFGISLFITPHRLSPSPNDFNSFNVFQFHSFYSIFIVTTVVKSTVSRVEKIYRSVVCIGEWEGGDENFILIF